MRNRLRDQRGVELVEFALTLPLLLVLVFALMDFGILLQRYQVVTNAAREGARLASMASLGYNNTDVTNRVNSYLSAGGVPSPATTATTTVTNASFTRSDGTAVPLTTVTVTYTYPMTVFSRFIRLIGGSSGPMTLRGVASMRVEGS